MTTDPRSFPIRRVGAGAKSAAGHHFFGYYDKTNWDRSGRYLLGHRVPFMDAGLTPTLAADIGYFDLQDGDTFHRVDETRAWNWQMGSQLQWLDGRSGRQMIYNVRTDDMQAFYPGFASGIHDVDSERKTLLPLPVYAVAPDSRYALCVDYRRLYITHETIGYSEPGNPFTLPWRPQKTAFTASIWRPAITS